MKLVIPFAILELVCLVVYAWNIIDGASTASPCYVTLRNLPKQIKKLTIL
jgi:hypothetical protein